MFLFTNDFVSHFGLIKADLWLCSGDFTVIPLWYVGKTMYEVWSIVTLLHSFQTAFQLSLLLY